MSEDVTIGPLRCIVCGHRVFGVNEWVKPSSHGPIYGLHEGSCTDTFGERGEWKPDGTPLVKPSIEQRVKALERQFDAHLHVKSLYRS